MVVDEPPRSKARPAEIGRQAHVVGRGRDLMWDALVTTADRLSRLSSDTVEVWAFRRGLVRVTEGLDAGDRWVHGLAQPVRWRWRLSRRWHEIQSIQKAAAEIGAFMRHRPDLG